MNYISGVFDDRGKFIYISEEEMQKVASWIVRCYAAPPRPRACRLSPVAAQRLRQRLRRERDARVRRLLRTASVPSRQPVFCQLIHTYPAARQRRFFSLSSSRTIQRYCSTPGDSTVSPTVLCQQ